MDILGKFLRWWAPYSQRRAERKALHLLVARKDRRLLRDAGLDLVEGSEPRCEPLPQTKERRWTAPLIRFLPPSPRKRAQGNIAPGTTTEKPAA